MRMLGAKVIVTPKANKATGMVDKAAELGELSIPIICHIAAHIMANLIFALHPVL